MFGLFRKIINSDKSFSEILTGSMWALTARVIATVLGFLSSVIIARTYGADVIGVVAVVSSFLSLTSIFTVLGTDTSLLRLIPEHLTNYSATSAFFVYRKSQFMVVVVSLAVSLALFFGADFIADQFFSKPHLSSYFKIASVFIVFNSLVLLNTQAVRGLRLVRAFAFMQILPQGTNLLFLIFVGIFWPSQAVPVYALLSGLVATGLVGWTIMLYAFHGKKSLNDEVQVVSYREILSISLPMFIAATMTFVIGQTGVVLLGVYRSEAEVGYYAVAVKLATLISFILSAVNSMAGPKFSELFHSGKIDDLFHVAKKSAKLTFWITTPILFTLLFFGRPLLIVLFGTEFSVAYPALVLLVLGQFVHSISGATGLFMNMTGNQIVFRNIVVIAAISNIIMNITLIPQYGIFGAATAAMISLSLWNISTLLYIKYKFGKTTGYFPLIG